MTSEEHRPVANRTKSLMAHGEMMSRVDLHANFDLHKSEEYITSVKISAPGSFLHQKDGFEL